MTEQRDNRVGKSRLTNSEGVLLTFGFAVYAAAEIITNGWSGVVAAFGVLLIIAALS